MRVEFSLVFKQPIGLEDKSRVYVEFTQSDVVEAFMAALTVSEKNALLYKIGQFIIEGKSISIIAGMHNNNNHNNNNCQ